METFTTNLLLFLQALWIWLQAHCLVTFNHLIPSRRLWQTLRCFRFGRSVFHGSLLSFMMEVCALCVERRQQRSRRMIMECWFTLMRAGISEGSRSRRRSAVCAGLCIRGGSLRHGDLEEGRSFETSNWYNLIYLWLFMYVVNSQSKY